MRIGLFGGLRLEHDGRALEVSGRMQLAVLFRLAVDAGTVVSYRAIAEDVWSDPPENARAALQSIVSRLRGQLPPGAIESATGGYRLAVARADVDVLAFTDLVAAAEEEAAGGDARAAAELAREALALWTGEPWAPPGDFDWFARDLVRDRARALELGGVAVPRGEHIRPARVPVTLTPLVGRERERATLVDQLAANRLVTLVGPGGAGKTRLAVEVACDRRDAVFVELAPAGPDELWQAILGALGRDIRGADAQQETAPTDLERVIGGLAGRDALLVLDNCEHLVDAAAAVVVELLGALPRLRVLTTSREPLGVPGEAFVPVGPLPEDDAERLFSERVRAARGAPLEADEAEAAERIRRRLDGLPLALELAAAKARTLAIEEIAAGLDDRFELLGGGLRTVRPRHQTLRALIDWSWELLSEGERHMLAAASIYPAGIAAADAPVVAAAHGGSRAELDALVDKSLLHRVAGRYRALETIREYGVEKLAASGGLPNARLTQARVLAEACRRHDAQLRGAGIRDALAWFDAEDDNVASALRFLRDRGAGEELVRLVAVNTWYWVIRDRNEDARTWIEAAAPHARALTGEDALIVRAMSVMASGLAAFEGDPDSSGWDARELDEIEEHSRGARNELLQVFPRLLRTFGSGVTGRGRLARIRVDPASERALAPWSRAVLAVMQAALAHNRGDRRELGRESERALALFRDNGDLWGLAVAQQMRAEWLLLEGRLEEALRMSDEATEAMRGITSSWDLQQQEGFAVGALVRLGRMDEARERAERLLASARARGSARAIGLACLSAAVVAVAVEDVRRARELLDESEANDAEWAQPPAQLVAMRHVTWAGIHVLEHAPDLAERSLREAVEAATASRDQPVMAMVAVTVGLLALERGRRDDARRALAFAVALRGGPDPFEPGEARLRSALGEEPRAIDARGELRTSADAVSDELRQILRR